MVGHHMPSLNPASASLFCAAISARPVLEILLCPALLRRHPREQPRLADAVCQLSRLNPFTSKPPTSLAPIAGLGKMGPSIPNSFSVRR